MRNIKLEKIIESQRDFFNQGETKEVNFRISQLKILKKSISTSEKDFLTALKEDLHKPEFEAYLGDIGFTLNEIWNTLKNIKSWAKPKRVRTPLLHFPASSHIYKEPLGNVLIMGPWNYPVQLLLTPLIGSIAAGNCSILKPSEFAPKTSGLISKLMEDNFDPRYISVVEGDAKTAQELLEHKFDYIFFTGGTDIGKEVYKAAAKNLTPVTLELGGKSPCIVEKDAQIDYSARRIAWGKFFNAGQSCVAPDYLLVHQSIKNQFIEHLKKHIKKFYGEEPFNSKDYARIVNKKHFNRLYNLLNEGEIILGGEYIPNDLYIAPTILNNVSWEDKIMEEEIFGPILPVIEYEDLRDIIKKINKKPKSLALYLFSENREVQKRIIKETFSGGVCINDTLSHMTTEFLPFGGVGDSGMGKYHGKASFDTFSQERSIMKKSLNTFFDIPMRIRYPPYKKRFLSLIKKF